MVYFPTYPCLQGDNHPITPVMLGDARLAVEFADEMLGKDGVYIKLYTYIINAHNWKFCHFFPSTSKL